MAKVQHRTATRRRCRKCHPATAYSDGITEAENPADRPFDKDGLERAVHTYASSPAPDLARTLFTVVEQHAGDWKLADDLTVVVVKRTDVVPPPFPADG